MNTLNLTKCFVQQINKHKLRQKTIASLDAVSSQRVSNHFEALYMWACVPDPLLPGQGSRPGENQIAECSVLHHFDSGLDFNFNANKYFFHFRVLCRDGLLTQAHVYKSYSNQGSLYGEKWRRLLSYQSTQQVLCGMHVTKPVTPYQVLDGLSWKPQPGF